MNGNETHEPGAANAKPNTDSTIARVVAPEGALLVVVDGREPGRVFTLGRTDESIGRDPSADICVDEAAVSQLHAKVYLQQGQYHIADLDSTNGTFINGEAVDEEGTLLRPGDIVRIGETTLQYVVPSDAASKHTLELPQNRAGGPLRLRRQGGHLPATSKEEPGFRELVANGVAGYRFAGRHKKKILGLGVIGAGLGVATMLAHPPEAEAALELRLKPVETPNPLEPQNANAREAAAADLAKTFDADFKTRELVDETLQEINDEKPTAQQVQAALATLEVSNTSPMSYRSSFAHASPEYAQKFLEAHLENFIAHEVGEQAEVARGEVEFLKGQLAENEDELKRVEDALRDFKKEHLEGLPAQAESQFNALVDLRAREGVLVAQAERYRGELGLARTRLNSEDSTVELRLESSQPYQEGIVETRRKLSEARASGFGDEHPAIVKLQRELGELEGLKKQTLKQRVSAIEEQTVRKALKNNMDDLQVMHSSAAKELGEVRKQIKKIEGLVEELPQVEAKYAKLNRSYESLQELHHKLFQRLKSAEVNLEFARAAAAARYDVTHPPEVVPKSFQGATVMRAGVGGILGLIMALFIAGVVELRRYIRRMNL